MSSPEKTPKRRLRKSIKLTELTKCKLKVRRLERRVKDLEEKLSGGRVFGDGKFCDLTYAARYLGKSKQTLRNWKSKGIGPKVHAESGSVNYKIADLDAYLLDGIGARHEET